MSVDTLPIIALGLLFLGIALTMHIYSQADKEAFEELCRYLRIVRRVTAQELEGSLRESIRFTAEEGIRILNKLEGAAATVDRDAVRVLLEGYREPAALEHLLPAQALRMPISPCKAKDWWVQFQADWEVLRTHVATTLPAAQRHIRRTSR